MKVFSIPAEWFPSQFFDGFGKLENRGGAPVRQVRHYNRIHKGKAVTDVYYGILKAAYRS